MLFREYAVEAALYLVAGLLQTAIEGRPCHGIENRLLDTVDF
jgi:hypothetical protein